MKKSILIIVISLIFISSISARVKTRSFDLQGAFGTVAEIDIEPVAAQTQSYIQGMPFNIEDELVQYNEVVDDKGNREIQSGRYIADMSLISNKDFNIFIRADKLRSVRANKEGNHAELDYVLTFDCSLAYYTPSSGGTSTEDTPTPTEDNIRLIYDTSAAGTNWLMYDIFEDGTAFLGFVGSLNSSVYFHFTKEASNTISTAKNSADGGYETLPYGDYTANVYIVLEATV